MEQAFLDLHNIEISEDVKKRTRQELISMINNQQIKDFMNDNNLAANDPIVLNAYAPIKEYLRGGIYPGYEPILTVRYGWIAIVYYPSNTPEAKRIHEGFFTHRRYDKVTEKYKNITLKSVHNTAGKRNIINAINGFVTSYQFGKVNYGGWVCGDFGRGKTYAMGALSSELHNAGHGVYFVNFNQYLRDLTDRMGPNRGNEYNNFFNQHARYEVMIIDDIGQEQVSQYTVKGVLKRLLEERVSAGLSTWFTSNLTQREYYKRLEKNKEIDFMDVRYIQERIEVLSREIIVTGDNLREKAKDKEL